MRAATAFRATVFTAALSLTLLAFAPAARADEGMWTYQDFPAALVKQRYGTDITPAWLDRVRTSTVRLSNCTASFVSATGLILTNHHCSAACLDENSTQQSNLFGNGFLAATREREVRCRTQIADVLMEMENITAKVDAATRGLSDTAANDARKKTLTQLEQACEQASATGKQGPLKCESVDLYDGGQYWLYKYKRYDDVRLVFAPEYAIAAFGGDPDNFQFPRWCLDLSILRAYDSSGKPVTPTNFLQLAPNGPTAGQLVFVSGHPGSTDRLLTVSQLRTLQAVDYPQWLIRNSELRGRYIQFGKASAEARRIVEQPLEGIENSIKVRRKLLDALDDERLFATKIQEERDLRAKVEADPQLKAATGDPWGEISRAELIKRDIWVPYTYLESAGGFSSALFRYARALVRGAAERSKASGERLREYRDTALPRIEQQLRAKLPVHPDLEKMTLSYSLERMREWLGPDDPVVRQLLAKDSPDTLAARAVNNSKLADPQVRLQLWTGGQKAIDQSTDPMIQLARRVDAASRAIRKRYEDGVEAPEQAASEKIARARFKVFGTGAPPDANFTLRLNFGTVQGWKEPDHTVEPFSRLKRLYERDTGQDPFKVPANWLAAKNTLDPNTPFNLSTNNDIVGGNSGSPLIDAQGRVVGLIFDGNIHSISGSFWFDAERNRAVAVDPAIIRVALQKVYKADALLSELGMK
ncbi:MAG TPA: S46 family peptidase [Steroidobacteraceae bacterium]|jgi:hypothetical protein